MAQICVQAYIHDGETLQPAGLWEMMLQTHLLDWPTRIVAAAVFKILPTNFSLKKKKKKKNRKKKYHTHNI